MRRLLRGMAENRQLGTTTLADPGAVHEIHERATAEAAKEEWERRDRCGGFLDARDGYGSTGLASTNPPNTTTPATAAQQR